MKGFSLEATEKDGYLWLVESTGLYSVHAKGFVTLDYRRDDVPKNGPNGTDKFTPNDNWVTKNAKAGQLVIVKDGEYIAFSEGIRLNCERGEEIVFVVNDALPSGFDDNDGRFDIYLVFRGERLEGEEIISQYAYNTMHSFEIKQVYKEVDRILDSIVDVAINHSLRYAEGWLLDRYGEEEEVPRRGDEDRYRREIKAAIAVRNSSGLFRDDVNIIRNLYPSVMDIKRFRRSRGRHAFQLEGRSAPDDPGLIATSIRSVMQGYAESFTLIDQNTFVLGEPWKEKFCVSLEKNSDYEMRLTRTSEMVAPYDCKWTIEEIFPYGNKKESEFRVDAKQYYRGLSGNISKGEILNISYGSADIVRKIVIYGTDENGVYIESNENETWKIKASGQVWYNVSDPNKYRYPTEGLYIYKNSDPRIIFYEDMEISVSNGDRIKFIFHDTIYTDNGGHYDVEVHKYKLNGDHIGIAKIRMEGVIN